MKMNNCLFIAGIIAILLFFAGEGSVVPETRSDNSPVKIGLLIPSPSCKSARQGAEMAINEANRQGGYHGRPFKLMVKSMEGPWGTGSKQAVDLIFKDEVWAIMGSGDGRNAHLVEQATVKTRVVFLSAWAGDPTLSQAFVPLFFSCVPNDLQQADDLIGEIWIKRKIGSVMVVHDNDYDSKQAFFAFQRQAGDAGIKMPDDILIKDDGAGLKDVVEITSKAGALVLFLRPKTAVAVVKSLPGNHAPLLFGSLRTLDENLLTTDERGLLKQKMWVPFNVNLDQSFVLNFSLHYKESPGIMAAFAYDGMKIIIQAIKVTSLDHEKIRESMAKASCKGVTGSFRFDASGNRISN